MKTATTTNLIIALVLTSLAPGAAIADDKDDVTALVMSYANLEGNLVEQAKLIRSDRIMITNVRQTDQAKNLEIQLAARKANNDNNGGPAKWITEVEGLQVRVYGNAAVASMVRRFHIYPPGAAPINSPPHWLTLVLVKEGRSWGIAHSHISPTFQPPN